MRRWRSLTWALLSVLVCAAVLIAWRLGKGGAEGRGSRVQGNHAPAAAESDEGGPRITNDSLIANSQSPITNSPTPDTRRSTLPSTNRFDYRLANTTRPLAELARTEHAILLENALFDSEQPIAPAIPDQLRALGDPGAYIVQSRGPLNNAFRQQLKDAGAAIVAYIPNDAYLVRATAAAAQQLSAEPMTQAVVPYEAPYKLKWPLVKFAFDQTWLPPDTALNLLLFDGTRDAILPQLQQLGVQVIGEDRSPFGPVLRVLPPADALPALARLPAVQEIEIAHVRAPANDLSRVAIGVSTDLITTTNYLGLTGAGILVNINDTGVDSTHPDLAGRVFSDTPLSATDLDGHGTHVAGIIASSGGQSLTVTNASLLGATGTPLFYSGTNTQFRGKAPAANLFCLLADPNLGPTVSDAYLQETAAKTNAFISNNSWNYVNDPTYDLPAASYDAAVRDALPLVTGSQPVLFVFSAGNSGNGLDDGSLGVPDTIQSPATAKNVITVGAIEQPRGITNTIILNCVTNVTPVSTNVVCDTNAPFGGLTDSPVPSKGVPAQVASFSSRGSVGVNIEGMFGRFKPDVVAPGTFVISTRSKFWTAGFTSHEPLVLRNQILASGAEFTNTLFVPANAIAFTIRVITNGNTVNTLTNLPIFVRQIAPPAPPVFDYSGVNQVTVPVAPPQVGVDWFYSVINSNAQTAVFDLLTDVIVTNDSNTSMILSNLNSGLGPYYRYETGTSMSAGDVSGTLALMQQFFTQRLGMTNSPALMKALLINGARSLGNSFYDLSVDKPLNSQGWGLINITNTIPGALASPNQNSPSNSMFLVEQSPTNALATGDTHTYKVTVAPEAQIQPLRITLVWTDPPGNPATSIKLVNDLDLIVTNLDDPTLVFFGNDIPSGSDFSTAWDTNKAPNIDFVNNVENIYLDGSFDVPLAGQYSITVVGHRVNVNAVTAHTNDVVQDFALVVSSGNGDITNALTFTDVGTTATTSPLVTTIGNDLTNSPGISGGTLYDQRVGANTPLRGTNNIPLPNDANAVLTLGMTNQWHFYAITNIFGFTNAEFETFLPPNLSIPRIGVREVLQDNATRVEADIDLYVTTNAALTNLDPVAIAGSYKSQGRTGTETIVLSNAVPGIYYLGVKSEDQMAAQYAVRGLFSSLPFAGADALGNQYLRGLGLPQPIPDGTPSNPGGINVPIEPASPMLVRRVVVTNILSHERMSDLIGILANNGTPVALNNKAPDGSVTNRVYIYDDSGQGDIPGAIHSAGPGSLHDFAGKTIGPQWQFVMTDNAYTQVGTENGVYIFLERQQDLTQGIAVNILPGTCNEQFIQVPNNATSMTISATVLSGTGPVTLQVCQYLPAGPCSLPVVVGTGNSITLDQFSAPQLIPGDTYVVRLCNNGFDPVNVYLIASFGFGSLRFPTIQFATNAFQAIPDDAVSYSTIFVSNHVSVLSLDVGMLVSHPRVSDLAITLISPNGTRVLLFENRGALSTNGLGSFMLSSNGLSVASFSNTNMMDFYTNDFDSAAVGPYAVGAKFEDWTVLSNLVTVIPDYTDLCFSNNLLLLEEGMVSNTLPTTNSTSYRLSFSITHAPYLVGTVGWWPFDVDASDIFGSHDGLLCGDPYFTTGQNVLFFDDFNGPFLNGVWQAALPNAREGSFPFGSPPQIANYIGAANFVFQMLGGSTVLHMTNSLRTQQRRGWSSSTVFQPNNFRYEARFNTLNQGPGISQDAFFEIWVFDPANTNRYDILSFFGGSSGTDRRFFSGSSIDNAWNNDSFVYQNNTWYRFVLEAAPGQNIRASVHDDAGNELFGRNFAHKAAAFSSGFKIAISQAMGLPVSNPSPVDVALDFVRLTTLQSGEVNQAIIGDGIGTSVTVPGCPDVDVGTLEGFSLEGWINPINVTNAAPLIEWYGAPTNQPQGVQLWLAGRFSSNGGPGSLSANLWGTNGLPHVIETLPGAFTNAAWQHFALTYDTNSSTARLYTNGQLAVSQVYTPHFVPQTSGDLLFGFHPTGPSLGYSFGGGMDEFGLYNRALTPCEVAAIYHAGTGGKYGTNVLTCPVTNIVQLPGIITTTFINGLNWSNTGPQWETNVIAFQTPTAGPPTPVLVTSQDPNSALDAFVLSALLTNSVDGDLHFTEDTNVALVPIKFAPAPYTISNFPPMLIFSNDFEFVNPGDYRAGDVLPASPGGGIRDWQVLGGRLTVISNWMDHLDSQGTNFVALARGVIGCSLPTSPGHRYVLAYTLRGPCAVGWWNGAIEPLSRRALDLAGGNHGAFFYGATNSLNAYVGDRSLYFDGMLTDESPGGEPYEFANDTDDIGSKLELGDPQNLRLTNALTIEGWIQPILQTNYIGTEMIFFRGDQRNCFDPYYFALEPAFNGDLQRRELHLHVEDATGQNCGFDLFTSNSPVTLANWQHVAAIFESRVPWDANPAIFTNQLRIYFNGVLIASNYTSIAPFRDLEPSFSPGVAIGNRSRADSSLPFRGYMDELSVYGRAITDTELAAIVAAGRVGKADLTVPPAQSLAKLRVFLNGLQMDQAYGDNSKWSTHQFTFTAQATNEFLVLQSLLPGTLVDNIALTEIPAELDYLPEESLDVLNGQDAYGAWKLEIWDDRAGATNNDPELVSWQLNFRLLPVNVPPIVHLQHGISYSNSLPVNGVQYFIVDVPQWATITTNLLLSCFQHLTATPLPATVLFDQTNFPTLADPVLIGPANTGTALISSNTAPPLMVGQSYYLVVTNPNPVAVDFNLEIAFDMTGLANCQPTTNYFVGPAGIPRYFQFSVPTNLPSLPPQEVTFWLYGAQSNVTVVLSQHLPLPDLDHYDYISQQPCTNQEIVMVVTNSTPFNVETNSWYVGVFNTTQTNVAITVEACYSTNYPVLIPLTNGIAYHADTNINSQFIAPPGPPQWFFFQFQITNATVDAILFELYDLSGDADLVLQKDVPPGMAPYYAVSFQESTNAEQIVVRANTNDVPDLRGNWILGVYNNDFTNISYTIRAVTGRPVTDLLVSGQPIIISVVTLPSGIPLLEWNGVVGEYYEVQFTPSLFPPVSWQVVGALVATTTCPNIVLPEPALGPGYFRLAQGKVPSLANQAPPVLSIRPWPARQVRISWPSSTLGWTLQSAPALVGPWNTVAAPANIEINEWAVYDGTGNAATYYRLFR